MNDIEKASEASRQFIAHARDLGECMVRAWTAFAQRASHAAKTMRCDERRQEEKQA